MYSCDFRACAVWWTYGDSQIAMTHNHVVALFPGSPLHAHVREERKDEDQSGKLSHDSRRHSPSL